MKSIPMFMHKFMLKFTPNTQRTLTQLSLICACIVMTQGYAHAHNLYNTIMNDAEKYVQKLDNSCTYDDGYTCLKSTDANFTDLAALERMIPASYLSSWPVALAAFEQLPELSPLQKKLMHYKIGFAEDEQNYVVMFTALLMPYVKDGKASGVSSATFGKSVQFSIDKESMTVKNTLFFK